jgi:ATP-dependent DNA helicase RecG
VVVTGEVQMVVDALQGEMKLKELMDALELSHRENFKNNYLEPAMKAGFIEMTYPDSPNHPNQKYRLTVEGAKLKKKISDK